ncbi:MAG TPA: hypothetical protein VHP38_16350, partial [Ruminiclostridium sp.]|nr:hypothetical protein [Ruminiclostridium sp.]
MCFRITDTNYILILLLMGSLQRTTALCLPKGVGYMKNQIDATKLSREVYDLPDYVAKALDVNGLWEQYRNRPPFQQNDYIGW